MKINDNAVLLVRVSTLIQDYNAQIEDLKKYAESKGYKKFHIIETKESGLKNLEDKIGVNELTRFISQNPEYRAVFCTEMSRLGRRESVLHSIKEWFIKEKIQFYLKDKNYQLFDENGKINSEGSLIFTLYGYFAESEITAKKDRFSRAKKYWAAQGISIGGKRLFGYNRVRLENGKNTYSLNEKESNEIKQIYYWYLHGIDNDKSKTSVKRITLECISKGFSRYTHSKRNVNKLLKEAAYIGFKVTNNKRKNTHYIEGGDEPKYLTSSTEIKYPRILSDELFNAVQKRLSRNNTTSDKSTKHNTVLAKKIICTTCGHFYLGQYRISSGGHLAHFYTCSSKKNIKPCPNKQTISMIMLDSAIWSVIKFDLHSLTQVIKNKTKDNSDKILREEVVKLKQKKSELETQLQLENKRFQILTQTRHTDSMQFVTEFEKNINRIDNDLGRIDSEIELKEESILILKKRYHEDLEQKIRNNLVQIESSKLLIKEYVNIFVESISIIYSDRKYSVIKTTMRDVFIRKPVHNDLAPDDILEPLIFIIIDKHDNHRIKVCYTTKNIRVNKSKISIKNYTYSLNELFNNLDQINQELINQYPLNVINKFTEEMSVFKQVPFIRLKVY